MGVLRAQAKMSDVENALTVAAFCRRRLGGCDGSGEDGGDRQCGEWGSLRGEGED